jgi:hypothetical protein
MKNLISFGRTIGPQAIEDMDEDLDKLWRFKTIRKCQLEMEMVCEMHKMKNIRDSYERPIVHKCVNIDVNSHFYDECIAPPLTSLELINKGHLDRHQCWVGLNFCRNMLGLSFRSFYDNQHGSFYYCYFTIDPRRVLKN